MAQGGGVEVDIETGRPTKETEAERENKDKIKLEEKAIFATLPKSEAGTFLIKMIETNLSTRISKFLQEDEECKAYNKMLQGIHAKTMDGQRAAKELIKKYYSKDVDTSAV